MTAFFIGLFAGAIVGFITCALMRANDVVETCPKCNGVRGFETGPNDWHDCDLCDATGKVRSND